MPTILKDGEVLTGPGLTAALAVATSDAVAQISAVTSVTSVAGRTGAISLDVSDISGAYASANPAGYQSAAQVAAAVTTGTVSSLNGRTGAVSFIFSDVSSALGFTPYDVANPNLYQTAGQLANALVPYAPLVSPALAGTPTAPTATTGTSTNQIATTSFVTASVVASTTGVASFNARTGAIALTSADVTGALSFTPYNATNPTGYQTAAQVTTSLAPYALLASPAFTGVPTAPTANRTLANSQIATTAFVRTGTTTNDNALAGQVGEFLTNNANAVSLTSTVVANVTSVSLTPGDWEVYGNVQFVAAGTTAFGFIASAISTVSATLPVNLTSSGGAYNLINSSGFATGSNQILPTGTTRIILATTTTVFLVGQASFSVSTMTANGYIGARRIR